MTTPSILITQKIIDDALMAGAVYVSSRNVINQIPAPSGWTSIKYLSLPSGFEAGAFQNGNNIVISYAGTDPTSWADWVANLALGIGIPALQLDQAVDFYLQAEALIVNNPNATISFTGHQIKGARLELISL
jgi:hypothetical protein